MRELAENRRLKGEIEAAALLWRRVLELAPDDASTLERLGTAYLLRGDAATARVHFERALSLAPDRATAWYNLALVCDQLGLAQPARAARERFVATAGPELAAQREAVERQLTGPTPPDVTGRR